MISASVAKKLVFVEHFARYGKKTAQMGCFTQYIVIVFKLYSWRIIQYVHHVDLSLDPYVHHQIQRGFQSQDQLLLIG